MSADLLCALTAISHAQAVSDATARHAPPATLTPPLSFPLLAPPAAKDSNTSDMSAIATLTARFNAYCAAQEEKERQWAEKERKMDEKERE